MPTSLSAQDPQVVLARSENGDALDVFIQALPRSTQDDQRGQFLSMADGAYRALLGQGLTPGNLVSGWIRFASAPPWNWRETLAEAWQASGILPVTALVQAPAEQFCACSLGLHAVKGAKGHGVWLASSTNPVAATFLRAGARHVRLMSVLPRAELCRDAGFADMTYDMFAQAGHALTARGLSFSNVVRTWVHARGIEDNRDAFDEGRGRFFNDQRVMRPPAMTCVEGSLVDVDAPIGMDVYAVSEGPGMSIEAVTAGAAFGMVEGPDHQLDSPGPAILREPGRRWLWSSAAAGSDLHGSTTSVGDVRGHLDRMFSDVTSLFARARMGLADVLSATAYLRSREHLGDFHEAARACGLSSGIPCVVAVTGLYPPESVCQIELCAACEDGG